MVGGGGTQGSLVYGSLPGGMQRGYAVATTDTGHKSSDATFRWMTLPGTFNDWAFRGTHLTTVRAKSIIKAFYGDAPRRSYFQGCSGGGQQAMTEVQRTNDYDGVIAGAPAMNWGPLMAGELSNNIAMRNTDPAGPFPAAKLALVNAAVLAACDAADGLLDGIVQDPRMCNFDPSMLACIGADTTSCLTPPQVKAVERTYQGAVNPRTSELIYPGLMPGGEPLWTPLISGSVPSAATMLTTSGGYSTIRIGITRLSTLMVTTLMRGASWARWTARTIRTCATSATAAPS
jgi:feruloyl esterase